MTGVSIRVDVQDAQVRQALGALLDRGTDLRPAMDKIGSALASLVDTMPPRERQPAAFVFPISETAGPNTVAMAVVQRVVARFGVLLVLGNLADKRGEKAARELEAVKDTVRGVFLGWAPLAGFEPCVFIGSRVVELRNGTIWWLLEFTSDTYIRNTTN